MNKSMTLASVALAALLVIPAGSASWGSFGTMEPDTVLDSTSLMWSDPPAPGQARVYFNAYTASAGTNFNPNVGALGTKNEAAGTERYFAILGVWTDCNGDGYVGLAETAAREYRQNANTNVGANPANPVHCPAKSGVVPGGNAATCPFTAVRPCPDWPATGWNNYDNSVLELIPIVSTGFSKQNDARIIHDAQAAVWGDYGRPNDRATGGTCATTPLPRGTTQSSGGLLNYADCRAAVLETFNAAADATGPTSALRFSDANNGRSGPLGQVETFGDRWDDPNRNAEEKTIVKAQDCDQAPLVRWDDTPLGPTVRSQRIEQEGIRAPSTTHGTAGVNPNGDVASTVNYTMESGHFPTRQVSVDTGPSSTSNCDFSDDRGDDFYNTVLPEGDFNNVGIVAKAQAQWNFIAQWAVFGAGTSRGGIPLGLARTGSAGDPTDAGLTPFAVVCGICSHTEWNANVNFLKGAPGTVVNRGGTTPDNMPNPGIADGYWITTYARVGVNATRVAALPGGTGEYASAQCGGIYNVPNRVLNGFNCNAADWNKNPDGSAIPANGYLQAYPGLSYQLRDVDCYDGSNNAGVPLGLRAVGPRPCSSG